MSQVPRRFINIILFFPRALKAGEVADYNAL